VRPDVPEEHPAVLAIVLPFLEGARPDLGDRRLELYRAACRMIREHEAAPTLANVVRWLDRYVGPGPGGRRPRGRPPVDPIDVINRYVTAVRTVRRAGGSPSDERVSEEMGIQLGTLTRWRERYSRPEGSAETRQVR
jgi:hypothetical protein